MVSKRLKKEKKEKRDKKEKKIKKKGKKGNKKDKKEKQKKEEKSKTDNGSHVRAFTFKMGLIALYFSTVQPINPVASRTVRQNFGIGKTTGLGVAYNI